METSLTFFNQYLNHIWITKPRNYSAAQQQFNSHLVSSRSEPLRTLPFWDVSGKGNSESNTKFCILKHVHGALSRPHNLGLLPAFVPKSKRADISEYAGSPETPVLSTLDTTNRLLTINLETLFSFLTRELLHCHFSENDSFPTLHSVLHTDRFVTITNHNHHWMPLLDIWIAFQSQPWIILTRILYWESSTCPTEMRSDVFCQRTKSAFCSTSPWPLNLFLDRNPGNQTWL